MISFFSCTVYVGVWCKKILSNFNTFFVTEISVGEVWWRNELVLEK